MDSPSGAGRQAALSMPACSRQADRQAGGNDAADVIPAGIAGIQIFRKS
jgi:hypothetical protein